LHGIAQLQPDERIYISKEDLIDILSIFKWENVMKYQNGA